MHRLLAVPLVVLLVLACLPAVLAQAATEGPKVTVSAANKGIADVAADIAKQSGLQVGLVDKSQAVASLDLKEAEVEKAVRELGKAFDGSWMRAYVLETSPPSGTYSADQLAQKMQEFRDDWMQSMTPEERQALFSRFRQNGQAGQPGQPGMAPGQPGAAGGPIPDMPGGARSSRSGFGQRNQGGAQPGQPGVAAAPGGGAPAAAPGAAAPGAPGAGAPGAGAPGAGAPGAGAAGQFGGGGRLYDPIAQLLGRQRTETITLKLDNVPVKTALQNFMLESGFIAWPEKELTGNVTLDVKDAPLTEVLDKIAKATDAKWRTVYLLCEPRELSQDERDQMQTAAEDRMLQTFWAKSPEERQQEIQRRVGQINDWAQAAQQDPNGRAAQALQRFGPRILQGIARRAANMSPEQRLEISPVLQALGRAIQRR